jgi:excisionase family DNA binding protein
MLTTGEAARAVGVSRSTLARWHQEGVVKPAIVTVGGHARWFLDDLRAQIIAIRERDQPPGPPMAAD